MKDRPYILAIDDDPFYLNEMRLELEGHADFKLFQGPNEFEDRVTKDDIENADLIVVDYDFGHGTAIKSQIAAYIRNELFFKGRILLWSLHEDFKRDNDAIHKEYDFIVNKRDLTWERFSSMLN